MRVASACGDAARTILPDRVRNEESASNAEIGSFICFLMTPEETVVDGPTESTLSTGVTGVDADAIATLFRGRLILRLDDEERI